MIRTVFAMCALWACASGAFAQTVIARAAISPAGRYVALETTTGERHALSLFDNDNADAPVRSFNLAQHNVERISWASERYVLIFTSQLGPGQMLGNREAAASVQFGRSEASTVDLNQTTFTTLYALDTETMRAVQMLAGVRSVSFTNRLDDVASLAPAGASGRIMMRAPIWMDDRSLGETTVVQRNPITDTPVRGLGGQDTIVGQRGVLALWSVNLADGRAEMIGDPDLSTTSWIVDAAGAPRARLDYVNEGYALVRMEGRTPGARVRVEAPEGMRLSVIGLRGDGRTAEMAMWSGEGARSLMLLDLETGALRPHEASGAAPVFDEATGLVAAVRGAGGLAWTDAARQRAQAQLNEAFQGAPVEIVSSSVSGERHVFKVRQGATTNYYYFDAVAARADILGEGAP